METRGQGKKEDGAGRVGGGQDFQINYRYWEGRAEDTSQKIFFGQG